MARLPFVERADIPEELQYVWDRNTTDGALPNIFRTMANNPILWRAYLRLGNALWTHSGLDIATRELAILRTAILHHSLYEWHQHVHIGRRAGLSDGRILALHHWRASDAFTGPERALLEYVDALAASDHPSDEAHTALAEHFDSSTVVGINLLIGYYGMTARFLGGIEVETEGPFVGWQLQG
ncbi:MAG: carboxymuconolactone decarboxylase family protein [Dehalococcoidia bacterium]|uniref:carboxymuconolactone decarboxylase family protein n=1 Tax=Candidatus Amarobacter glycogenicus TaxID=3140699 RepID=UPI003136971E|nr:carboxymuconolactone decarboxylase family protein [Dehalococcoidia bacterium]MBK9343729.1 carboxymuconolactone decarboxylase family protein [Dehalococcoidia bacterium]